MRAQVEKISTGARYSSAMPESGVWRKDSLGTKHHNTQAVGTVTHGFYPTSRRNRHKFRVLS